MEKTYKLKNYNPALAGAKGTETDFAVLLYMIEEVNQKIVHRYMAAGRSGDKDSASYQAKFLKLLWKFNEEASQLHIRPLNPMLLN